MKEKIVTKKILRAIPKSHRSLASHMVQSGVKGSTTKKIGSVRSVLNKIVARHDQSQEDIDIIRSGMPEISMVERIIVSLMLSDDMTDEGLAIQTKSDDTKDQDLAKEIGDTIKSIYKIDEILEDIIVKCLFEVGSYPVMIIPETSVSKAIRHGLKNPSNFTLESKDFSAVDFLGVKNNDERNTKMKDLSIEVSSDPNIVYHHLYKDVKNAKEIESKMSEFIGTDLYAHTPGDSAMEANKETKIDDAVSIVMSANRQYNTIDEMSMSFDMSKTESEGYANRINLTARSVIPVVSRSDPSNPIGFYVLIDQQGRPIRPLGKEDLYRSMVEDKSSFDDLVEKLGVRVAGRETKEDNTESLVHEYEKVLNETLAAHLRESSMYKDTEIDVDFRSSIMETMMWRSMKQRKTRVLFVPERFMTYFKFNHDDHGVGRSLIEDNRVTAAMYANVLYAYNMAAAKNATIHRTLNIKLDPDDDDPETYVRDTIDETTKNLARSGIPGGLNPIDVMSSISANNMSIAVDPNGNTKYPDVSANIEGQSGNSGTLDLDYLDRVRNRFLLSFWVMPSWVDMSSPVEFSRQIANESMLMTKRITVLQKRMEPQLSDLISKLTMYSPEIMNKVRSVHKTPEKVREFINSLYAVLPKATVDQFEQQSEKLASYADHLDEAVERILGNDQLTSVFLGDVADDLPDMIPLIKSQLIREYMDREGILTEFTQFMNYDKEVLLRFRNNAKDLAKMMSKIHGEVTKIRDKVGKSEEEETPPTGTTPPAGTPEAEPEAEAPAEGAKSEEESEQETPPTEEAGEPEATDEEDADGDEPETTES